MQNGEEVSGYSWFGLNSTQESWTIFSFACYPLFAGCSFYIGFDTITFFRDIDEIWK